MKFSDIAVYVVDDDPSVSGALKRLMRSEGFGRVETFASAEDFLKHEGFEKGAMLILDIMLPAISGIDLQQFLRSAGLSTTTVFISAHDHELEKARIECPEALAFLLKPFGGEELLKAARKAFSNQVKSGVIDPKPEAKTKGE